MQKSGEMSRSDSHHLWRSPGLGIVILIGALVAGYWWGLHPLSESHMSSLRITPSTQAKKAASAGILTSLSGKSAPKFRLIDQHNRVISLKQFLGKVIVLTPMDPTCTTVCPVLAQEISAANRELGPLSRQVVFIGFDADPYWANTHWLRKFDREHQLSHMANWYFVTGTTSALRNVWHDYYIWVQLLPKTRMVNHASYIYFIGPHGHERWILGGSAEKALGKSYTTLIDQYVRALLTKSHA